MNSFRLNFQHTMVTLPVTTWDRLVSANICILDNSPRLRDEQVILVCILHTYAPDDSRRLGDDAQLHHS